MRGFRFACVQKIVFCGVTVWATNNLLKLQLLHHFHPVCHMRILLKVYFLH